MKLYHEGITRNTENKNIIAELKRAGYVEVKDEQPEKVSSGVINLSDGVSDEEARLASDTLNAAKGKAGKVGK